MRERLPYRPVTSRAILNWEEEIGARLFLRRNRKVQLTAAGTALLSEGENIRRRC